MTRILLPVLIGILVVLAGTILIPIAIREFGEPIRRRREIDEWLEDIR